jgi:glyoxylase-like metal-dependent hydrolase (beta-lactamase superfamily II)
MGRVLGYLPHRWPEWFEPDLIEFLDGPIGPFQHSARIVEDGSIVAVPLPGHSSGHLGVIVKSDRLDILLAGDASYNWDTVVAGIPSVVIGNKEAMRSVASIRQFAREHPTLFLSSHDPEVNTLLQAQGSATDARPVDPDAVSAEDG